MLLSAMAALTASELPPANGLLADDETSLVLVALIDPVRVAPMLILPALDTLPPATSAWTEPLTKLLTRRPPPATALVALRLSVLKKLRTVSTGLVV